MDRYEVSVAVLTYKPNKEKLLETLQSVLMQKDVRMQIVIADDGSAEPKFDVAEELFRESGFTDYVIVDNKENRGTVYNVQSAVQRCDGTYVKLISPGDLLADATTLRGWVDTIAADNAELSFSDVLYYVPDENGKTPVSRLAHPADVSCYRAHSPEKFRYHYLILKDLFLGAATLCRRETICKYVDEIAGKVCYAEDHIYRLMAYDGVRVSYFPQVAIIYETSTGISTSGNDFWQKKLQEDWDTADKLLFARCTGNTPFDRKLQRLADLPQSFGGKLMKYLFFPKMFFFHLKNKLSPRKSPLTLSKGE